jgi:hypothetical protein
MEHYLNQSPCPLTVQAVQQGAVDTLLQLAIRPEATPAVMHTPSNTDATPIGQNAAVDGGGALDFNIVEASTVSALQVSLTGRGILLGIRHPFKSTK